jgi:hypothetical protein
MPGYGILDPGAGTGLLPWSWAVERLTNSHNYWLSTTRPDGRPHAMPVWGLWLNGTFYFSAGRLSRKTRNLAVNPSCAVSTERADEAVIIEGVAEGVVDHALLEPFYDAYKAKYGWDMKKEPFVNEPVFIVHPQTVFAFTEKDLSGSATRWSFVETGGEAGGGED